MGLGGSVRCESGDQAVTGSIPTRSSNILCLQLIEVGHLSASSERMCTRTCKPLKGLSLPRKSVNLLSPDDPNGLFGS